MAKKKIIKEETAKVWSTLHIFGYGETQLNGSVEKKVSTSLLTKAQAVVDYIYSLKPSDNDAGTEFHAVTIVKGIFGRFVPKNVEKNVFSIEYKDLDTKVIEDLVAELESLPVVEPAEL